jgi:hypothetical protein
MRKIVALTVMSAFLSAVLSVFPAGAAAGRGWEGRGGGPHVGRSGCVGCGFFGGLVLGGILGGALAAPYAAPPPVYPPPVSPCYTQPGYWGRVSYVRPDGYTSYRTVWVPAQTVCQ